MSDFDYKKYSLEQLENWVHDVTSGDATSDEIYDCIVNVVRDNYYHHKKYADEARKLLTKLGSPLFEYTATGEKWTDFWEDYEEVLKEREYYEPTQAPLKWTLPVEQVHDEYFISFPDDLLKAAKLKEGDTVKWIDRGDGSFEIKKIVKEKTYDEMIADGWTMTADGFWIKESDNHHLFVK